jgi:hypothetical protein
LPNEKAQALQSGTASLLPEPGAGHNKYKFKIWPFCQENEKVLPVTNGRTPYIIHYISCTSSLFLKCS